MTHRAESGGALEGHAPICGGHLGDSSMTGRLSATLAQLSIPGLRVAALFVSH